MRDAVTSLIGSYDAIGRYFDRNAIDSLKAYFAEGDTRVQLAALINGSAADIVRDAGAQLFTEVPELIRPGGNAYTTRRFSACLRDMDYYLRYATYAIVASDTYVLDERVLQGLRETYNSLGVPIGPTVRGIQIMKGMIADMAKSNGMDATAILDQAFDHLSRDLSEKNI